METQKINYGNKTKPCTLLLLSWTLVCWILLLSACSTLRQPAPEQPAYRVTIILAPGYSETDLNTVLNSSPIRDLEFRPYTGGLDLGSYPGNGRALSVTIIGKAQVDHFRESLQQTSVALQAFIVQQLH
jgi:hypothetical protein